MKDESNHPSQSDAKLVERPFTLALSEHDLRHIRVILKRWAIEQKDWAQVRCAVGIYERINEQLSEETKGILSGPPKPERDRRAGFITAKPSTRTMVASNMPAFNVTDTAG